MNYCNKIPIGVSFRRYNKILQTDYWKRIPKISIYLSYRLLTNDLNDDLRIIYNLFYRHKIAIPVMNDNDFEMSESGKMHLRTCQVISVFIISYKINF